MDRRGRIGILAWALLQLAASAAAAGGDGANERLREAAFPGTGIIIVVSEGALEPRSIGSYSLRAYSGSDPRFPYDDFRWDDFLGGALMPRDGSVVDIRFADLDADGALEIIVVMRSAGSGSYISGDAFRFAGKAIDHVASVGGLPKDADPVPFLQAELAGTSDQVSSRNR